MLNKSEQVSATVQINSAPVNEQLRSDSKTQHLTPPLRFDEPLNMMKVPKRWFTVEIKRRRRKKKHCRFIHE